MSNLSNELKRQLIGFAPGLGEAGETKLPEVDDLIGRATHQPKGGNLLVVSDDTSETKFVDIYKLITGLAGIVSGIGALTISANFVAATAVVAALGSVKGISTNLVQDQGIICKLLIDASNKRIELDALDAQYQEYIQQNKPKGASPDEFEDALVELKNLGIIDQRDGLVILKQKIILKR